MEDCLLCLLPYNPVLNQWSKRLRFCSIARIQCRLTIPVLKSTRCGAHVLPHLWLWFILRHSWRSSTAIRRWVVCWCFSTIIPQKMWNYIKIPTYMTKPPFIRDVLFALIARRYSICWTEWCHFLCHSLRSARWTRKWSSTSVRLMGHPSRAPSRVVSPLPKYSI